MTPGEAGAFRTDVALAVLSPAGVNIPNAGGKDRQRHRAGSSGGFRGAAGLVDEPELSEESG